METELPTSSTLVWRASTRHPGTNKEEGGKMADRWELCEIKVIFLMVARTAFGLCAPRTLLFLCLASLRRKILIFTFKGPKKKKSATGGTKI